MAKFVIKKSSDNQFYWNFVANNGQVIATTERYTTKQNAENAAKLVKAEAATAEIVDEAK